MKYRIIVVEDKNSNLADLKKELSKRGYEIVDFGEKVKKILNEISDAHLTDYIITDITEPFINGIKLIENIKKCDHRIKNIAILAGHFTDTDIDMAVSLGCRVFIKPVDHVLFLDWLDKRKVNIPKDRNLQIL